MLMLFSNHLRHMMKCESLVWKTEPCMRTWPRLDLPDEFPIYKVIQVVVKMTLCMFRVLKITLKKGRQTINMFFLFLSICVFVACFFVCTGFKVVEFIDKCFRKVLGHTSCLFLIDIEHRSLN